MKALYAESASSFSLKEIHTPKPKNGEILIRVAACGICHTDVLIRQGEARHVTYPFVPGHEYAGYVVECGPGVKRVKVGDRGVVQQMITCGMCRPCKMGQSVGMCRERTEMGCCLDGGMAEYCVLPEGNFLPIPDTMTFDEATYVEPMANACNAMRTGRIQPNDKVVVIGPGPIGIVAAKLAKIFGAGRVYLVGTRDSRLKIAKENNFSIDEVVNIRKPGAEEYLMRDLLEGQGADVIMESSGALDALELSIRLMAEGARVLLEGTPKFDETVPFNGIRIPRSSSLNRISSWSELDFYNCMQFIASGQIDVKPLITHRYPLNEWEKGFDMAIHGKDEAIKVLLYNE